MSLLDNASLLLTPNAYKEGKLYSVIPSNGSGDFTATRATTATRVNSAGLVDLVPYNLLQYSEQFDNAYWTKVNSTITENAETAPNGTLTADLFTKTSNVNTVSQVATTSITYITTGAHTLSVYVKPNVGNQILLRLDNVGNTANFIFDFTTKTFTNSGANVISSSFDELPNGWFRLKVTGNVISTVWSLTPCNLFSNPTNDSMFIWGAQLVEGTSARDYLRTETRLNIPRVDYSLGGCPNILLEPQRTNLFLSSEAFNEGAWTKAGSSVTANTSLSPSGVLNADTMTGAATNPFVLRLITTVSATNYAISFYVKEDTQRYVFIRFVTAADNFVIAVYDLRDGVVGQTAVGSVSGTLVSATITPAANGFYRVMLVGSVVGTSANIGLSFANALTGNTFNNVGTTTVAPGTSVFLWGAQLEVGAYATSYIPTTTASVTRNADTITRNNIFTNGLITAAGGTWFVELRNNVEIRRENVGGGVFINAGVSSQIGTGFAFRNATTSGNNRFSISKVEASVLTNIYLTTTDTCKIAIKWNGSTADVFENGVKVVSATSFTATNMGNLIADGINRAVFINKMELFPTPLTDDQLIELTTL